MIEKISQNCLNFQIIKFRKALKRIEVDVTKFEESNELKLLKTTQT